MQSKLLEGTQCTCVVINSFPLLCFFPTILVVTVLLAGSYIGSCLPFMIEKRPCDLVGIVAEIIGLHKNWDFSFASSACWVQEAGLRGST